MLKQWLKKTIFGGLVREGNALLPACRTSELVARTRAGETMAFDVLVNTYKDLLAQVVHVLMRNKEDTEEIVQEAFIRGYRHLHEYDSARPFFPWLAGIAVKCCYETIRSNRRQPIPWSSRPESRDGPPGELPFPEDRFVDPSPAPDKVFEMKETEKLLLNLVYQLPTDDRLIVILRCFNGLPSDQVAKMLNVSVEHVWKRLHVSRERLSRQFHETMNSEVWTTP